jgi:hypothetical protein
MARSTGSGFRWLIAAIAVAPLPAIAQTAAPAQPATVPAATPATAPAQTRHSAKMKKIKPTDHPDAALIEYLGDYEDAADGLDPMGLGAHPEALQKTGKDGQQR